MERMNVVIKVIDLTTLALGIILGTRVVLKVLGANISTPFVAWIYSTMSDPLMAPFVGIFPAPAFGKAGVIDIPAFFALIVYLAGGYMISSAVESLGRNIKAKNLFRIAQSKDTTPLKKETN